MSLQLHVAKQLFRVVSHPSLFLAPISRAVFILTLTLPLSRETSRKSTPDGSLKETRRAVSTEVLKYVLRASRYGTASRRCEPSVPFMSHRDRGRNDEGLQHVDGGPILQEEEGVR